MQQAGRAAGSRAGGAGGVLARRLRSSLRLSSVAPPLSPFSPLLHRPRVPPAFFPSASALSRFAVASLSGWPRGAGGQPVGSVVRFALSVRATLRRPPYAPLSSSLLAGVLPASRPGLFPPAVCRPWPLRPPVGILATVSTYGRGRCRLLPSPPKQQSGRGGGFRPVALGTLPRGIRRDIAYAFALRAPAAAPPCLLPPPAPPALLPAARPACPCGVCSTWNIVVHATIYNRE